MDDEYTVRNSRTGAYLTYTTRQGEVVLSMGSRQIARAWERRTAEHIGATWIALTGDHDIEIEEA